MCLLKVKTIVTIISQLRIVGFLIREDDNMNGAWKLLDVRMIFTTNNLHILHGFEESVGNEFHLVATNVEKKNRLGGINHVSEVIFLSDTESLDTVIVLHHPTAKPTFSLTSIWINDELDRTVVWLVVYELISESLLPLMGRVEVQSSSGSSVSCELSKAWVLDVGHGLVLGNIRALWRTSIGFGELIDPRDDTVDISSTTWLRGREFSELPEVSILLAIVRCLERGSEGNFIMRAGVERVSHVGQTLGATENDISLEVWRSTFTNLPAEDTVSNEPGGKEVNDERFLIRGGVVQREAPKLRLHGEKIPNHFLCCV